MRKSRSPPCAPCHGGIHKRDEGEGEGEEDTGAGRAASTAFFSAAGDKGAGDLEDIARKSFGQGEDGMDARDYGGNVVEEGSR